MYDFLLQSIFFLSLGVVIYLMARAVPRISESGEVIHAPSRFDRLLSRLPLARIDEKLNGFFEKFLRRLKVLIMRSDNFINNHLSKIKKEADSKIKDDAKVSIFEKKDSQ